MSRTLDVKDCICISSSTQPYIFREMSFKETSSDILFKASPIMIYGVSEELRLAIMGILAIPFKDVVVVMALNPDKDMPESLVKSTTSGNVSISERSL